MSPLPFLATCEHRTEGVLRDELVALGIRAPRGGAGRVTWQGSLESGMRVCLHARTAMRVLVELAEGPAHDAQALYETVRALDWSEHLGPNNTFAVRAQIRDSATLIDTRFVAQKTKDAIVDQFRDATGARPSVERERPELPIEVHVDGATARIFLDLAGEPLHRRGYRVAMTEAPLKETLAAAVLAVGRVDPALPFWDPVCGSGTLAIEQALRARGIAPGLRRAFAFDRWPVRAHAEAWPAIRAEAEAQAKSAEPPPAPIRASDLDPAAVAAARRNAAAAGVAADITFSVEDAARITPHTETGILCMNLPYGERLIPGKTLTPRALARVLHLFWGHAAVVLSPTPDLGLALGVRPVFTHRLSNGGVPVLLQRYELGAPAET